MQKLTVSVLLLSLLLSGCGLVPIPHSLKMPSRDTIIVRDYQTGREVAQAKVSYYFYRWENWIKPLEYEWSIGEACFDLELLKPAIPEKNNLIAHHENYGLYRFSQKTKIGVSKFWGIGPLGSWLYDTYAGSYTICAPGYYRIHFSDSLHSYCSIQNDYILFEEDKILVYLVSSESDIPVEKRSYKGR